MYINLILQVSNTFKSPLFLAPFFPAQISCSYYSWAVLLYASLDKTLYQTNLNNSLSNGANQNALRQILYELQFFKD